MVFVRYIIGEHNQTRPVAMTTQMIHPSSVALSAYAMQTGVVGPYTILSITQVDHSHRWMIV